MCRDRRWRTKTGELLGRGPDAVHDLTQSGPGSGAVLHKGLEDVVKQTPPCVGSAMDLEGVDGGGGKEVLVELYTACGQPLGSYAEDWQLRARITIWVGPLVCRGGALAWSAAAWERVSKVGAWSFCDLEEYELRVWFGEDSSQLGQIMRVQRTVLLPEPSEVAIGASLGGN